MKTTERQPPSSPTRPIADRQRNIIVALACLAIGGWLLSLFSCSGPENVSTSSSERSFHLIDEQVKLKQATFACAKVDDLARIIQLLRQGDDAAAQQQFGRSDCGNIAQGVQAVVETNSGWNDAACVRPKGQASCVWVHNSFLEKDEDTP